MKWTINNVKKYFSKTKGKIIFNLCSNKRGAYV